MLCECHHTDHRTFPTAMHRDGHAPSGNQLSCHPLSHGGIGVYYSDSQLRVLQISTVGEPALGILRRYHSKRLCNGLI